MTNGLQMETGPRFLKPAIFGGLILAFGAATYVLVSPSDAAPKPAAASVESTPVATADSSANLAIPSDESDSSASNAAASTAPAAAETSAPVATAEPAATASTSASAPAITETAAIAAAAPADSASSEPKPEPMANQQEIADSSKPSKKSQPKMLRTPPPPASEALRAWWATPAQPQRLGIEYVGQAADQKSLVIRFNQQVADPAAEQNIRLVNSTGETVAADWKTGENPSVLFAPNLEPGRYTVLIGPELASVQGQSLGVQLHGPTFIQ